MNFTDNPQLTPFTPYTPQLPVEAMAAVGAERQQMYYAGVQKIQSEIDNVAGLDIYRDVDKNYLQSKLNELGNRLTSVAAGDFSNFQLVNSVSGMTKQLVKDRNIQNAVQSTAHIRNQFSEIEKAKKDGKWSSQNEWDFNEKLGQYITSPEVGQVFYGRYRPYTDLGKKAMETIKALHPKLAQYDIPFEVLSDGRINTRKIADAMKRYKIEGVDEFQIQQALAATMTPDDYEQLSIDARFRFKDASFQQLSYNTILNYERKEKQYKDDLDLLKQQQLTTSDPTKLEEISKRISEYEKALGKDGVPGTLFEELKSNLDYIKRNPDAAKIAIYKDGFVREYANAFSWKNQTQEYIKNPFKEQENFVAEMVHKQKEYQRKVYEFNATYEQNERKLALEAQKIALDRYLAYGEEGDWTPVAKDNTTLKNEAENMFASMVKDADDKIKSEYSAIKNNSQYNYTDKEIDIMVNKYVAYQQGKTKSPDVPAAFMSNIQNILKQKSYVASLEEKRKKLKAEAEAEVRKDLKSSYDELQKEKAKLPAGWDTLIPELGNMPAEIYFNYNEKQKKQIYNFKLKYKNLSDEIEKKVKDIYTSKLAPIVSSYIPQIKALPSDKNGAPTAATINKVSALLTRANVEKLSSGKFDFATASKYLSEAEKKDTRIFVEQQGDNYKLIIKNEKEPEKAQEVILSKNDVQSKFGQGYVNNLVQESVRLQMGRGNTNINADPDKAMLQKSFGDFPGITRLNIVADLQRDASNPNLYVPYIGIQKKDGGFSVFELAGNNKLSRVGFEQAKQNLQSLTDAQILAIIKQEYPNYDISKLEQ